MTAPHASIWGADLAVIDVETTGLEHRKADRVIEVAVARGRCGAAPEVWSVLVHPGRPVGATHIHGITDDMVAGAPRFPDVLPTLLAALDGAVPCAHNAPFDLAFLRAECLRAGAAVSFPPALDTLGLARRHLGLPSNALDALCQRFGIERERAHRAADDALATWRLAWCLLEVVDPDRTWTIDDALRRGRRRSPEETKALRERLVAAHHDGRVLLVDYVAGDRPGDPRTRRRITVRAVRTDRVVAFCHLRGAERTFRLDRLSVSDTDEPVGHT